MRTAPMTRRVNRPLVALVAATALLAGVGTSVLGPAGAAQASRGRAHQGAVEVGDAPDRPSEDPFYRPEGNLADVEPGAVLRSRPVTVRGLGLPLPVRAWQVLYRSTDAVGRPNAVMGTVMVAEDGRPAGDRPLVAYNIGTHGLAARCAPSYQLRLGTDAEQPLMAGALARGWAVAVTDYEGSATAGPHTYTAGPVTGRAVLDGARAALALPAAGLDSDAPVAIWGYSEGGLASSWAAQLAGGYAPELDIVGTAAGGVPADLVGIADRIDGGALSGFLLAAAVGLDEAYPRMRLGAALNDAGRAAVEQISGYCQYEWTAAYAFHEVGDFTTVADPLGLPRIQRILTANSLGRRAPNAPMYVYQAVDDEFIPVADVRELVRDYCRAGVAVRYVENPVGEHLTVAATGAPAALTWIADRFAAEPAPSTCPG